MQSSVTFAVSLSPSSKKFKIYRDIREEFRLEKVSFVSKDWEMFWKERRKEMSKVPIGTECVGKRSSFLQSLFFFSVVRFFTNLSSSLNLLSFSKIPHAATICKSFLAHRFAIFLCSLDDNLVGQLTTSFLFHWSLGDVNLHGNIRLSVLLWI